MIDESQPDIDAFLTPVRPAKRYTTSKTPRMLLIDIVILIGLAVALVAGAAVIGGRLGPWLERRRRRLQGAGNAADEQRRLTESCAACGESIDPAQDLWDATRWWHRQCHRDL